MVTDQAKVCEGHAGLPYEQKLAKPLLENTCIACLEVHTRMLSSSACKLLCNRPCMPLCNELEAQQSYQPLPLRLPLRQQWRPQGSSCRRR